MGIEKKGAKIAYHLTPQQDLTTITFLTEKDKEMSRKGIVSKASYTISQCVESFSHISGLGDEEYFNCRG